MYLNKLSVITFLFFQRSSRSYCLGKWYIWLFAIEYINNQMYQPVGLRSGFVSCNSGSWLTKTNINNNNESRYAIGHELWPRLGHRSSGHRVQVTLICLRTNSRCDAGSRLPTCTIFNVLPSGNNILNENFFIVFSNFLLYFLTRHSVEAIRTLVVLDALVSPRTGVCWFSICVKRWRITFDFPIGEMKQLIHNIWMKHSMFY